jgi:hypothetical protein
VATGTSAWILAPKNWLLAAMVAAIGLSGAAVGPVVPPAGAATPGLGVGAVGDITWGTSPADIDTTVSSMAAAGIGWVRANVAWSGAEPDAKGVLNQAWLLQVDYAVTRARAAGIQVLMPIADGVPYWASADPTKYRDGSGNHWNKYWRPTNPADYADFVGSMVTRYQALGVHTYEVWNEPNTATFWPSGPSATEYVQVLAAAYPAIKAADPSATVVLGGLSKNDYDYLAQLYTAGAAPYFDAVAVHPYTGIVDPTWCWNEAGTTKLAKDAFCGIEEVRRTMVAAGDSAKTMWLTEFGWSTNTGAYGVSETVQADFLVKAMNKIRSSYPFVQGAFWYNFRNNFWLNNSPADYEANLGLLRVDFSAKPAYTALQSWTGAPTTPVTVAPTTTTTVAPTTTTVAPAPTLSLANVRTQSVTATSATITWTTNVASSTRVDYGTTTLSFTATGAAGVTSHTVTLSGLAPRTSYSYRAQSVDASGKVALSATSAFTTAKK